MCNELGLSSPWACYAKRVKKLFDGDPDVIVEHDDAEGKLVILVNGDDKANAIEQLMPSCKTWGNVTLAIEVVPSNDEQTEADLFRKAFSGNANFVDVAEGYGPAGDISYALFMPDVAQIYEDDISEFDGLTTITMAQLAESVLGETQTKVSSAIIDD